MNNEIQVINKTEILGHEIQVISGGFGEDKKCLTDKQIAEIHEVKNIHIRELINKNIKRFKEGVDYIDLKDIDVNDNNLELLKTLEYSKMQISKSNNLYLLSERGYAKLVKIMDSDKAWEIHDELMDNYFIMRDIVNSEEQIKAMALLKAIEGNSTQDRLEGLNTYTEIKVKEETAPLIATIEEQKPEVEFANRVQEDNQKTYSLAEASKVLKLPVGRNIMMANLRRERVLRGNNEPYQSYIDRGYFILKS